MPARGLFLEYPETPRVDPTVNDAAQTLSSDDPRCVLRAWINDADMGGWPNVDEDAFRRAVVAEACDGFGCEPEELESIIIETA
jgi:hypothetical protein